jgi:hypothetical protein
MSSNQDNSGKGPGKPGDVPPKKPSAILDLKPTGVNINDAPGSKPADPPKTAAASEPPKAASATPPKPEAAKTDAPKSDAGRPDPAKPDSQKAGAMGVPPPKTGTAGAVPPRAAAPSGDQPPRRSGALTSMISHLAAGLAGGLIALIGADTLGTQLGVNAHGDDLERRLKAIETTARSPQVPAELGQRLAAAEQRLGRLDDVARQVQELQAAQSKLAASAQQPGAAPQGDQTDLAGRIAKLEETWNGLTSSASNDPQRARIPQFAQLSGRLSDLETSLANQIAQLRKSVSQDVEARFAAVSEATEAARSGTQRLDRDLAAVKTDITRAGQRMDGLKSVDDRLDQNVRSAQEEIANLRGQLDQVRNAVGDQVRTIAVEPLSKRIAGIEGSVQGVVKSEEDRRINAERIVLALELGSLKRAVDRGTPYTAELDNVARLSQGRLNLTVIGQYKDQGVPTATELAAEFRKQTNAVLDAADQNPEASVVDRLLAGAKTIVRVRRVDQGADDQSVEAVVARMESALKDARLADALGESKKLPPKAQAPVQAWLGKVSARVSVDQAIAEIENQLKQSMAGGKG